MAKALGSNRQRSLDGIRGVTATCVMLFHCLERARDYNTGRIGWAEPWINFVLREASFTVPVFMCLSGYVLGYQCITSLSFRGGIAAYARRRASRILPAYYFALVFSVLLAIAVPFPDWPSGHAAVVRNYGWGDVLYKIVSPALLLHDYWGDTNDYNVPLWSLPVEAHAYILLPIFVLIARITSRTAALVLISAASFAAMLILPWAYCQYYVIFFIGVATSYLTSAQDRPPATAPWTSALAFAGIAQIALLSVPTSLRGSPATHQILWAVISALLIICLSQNSLSRTSIFLERPSVQWLGMRSYSIYLLHWPLMISAELLTLHFGVRRWFPLTLDIMFLTVPTTLLLASFSWRYFEARAGAPTKRQHSSQDGVSTHNQVHPDRLLPQDHEGSRHR